MVTKIMLYIYAPLYRTSKLLIITEGQFMQSLSASWNVRAETVGHLTWVCCLTGSDSFQGSLFPGS